MARIKVRIKALKAAHKSMGGVVNVFQTNAKGIKNDMDTYIGKDKWDDANAKMYGVILKDRQEEMEKAGKTAEQYYEVLGFAITTYEALQDELKTVIGTKW